MSVTILVCPCGLRLKATGLSPGKSGRCPSCGALIRVPGAEPVPPTAGDVDDEWNWQGIYELGQAVKPLALRPLEPEPTPPPSPVDPWADELFDLPETTAPATPPDSEQADDEWGWHGTSYNLGADVAAPAPSPDANRPSNEVDDGPVPTPAPIGWTKDGEARTTHRPPPDAWWPPVLFYPLRGAEGVAMVITIGLALWVMATLVPEYCLSLQTSAEFWGAGLMGTLIGLITALPSVIMLPMVLIYWLQYLGRVLTASFEGETLPPRPPDRNFEGLFDGLGTWMLWGVLGLSIGFLPLAAYSIATAERSLTGNPGIAIALGLLGFPYALMALLIVFLNDDPLEAKPGGVLGTIAHLAPSFLGLCLTVGTIGGSAVLAFVGAFLLRPKAFGLFIGASLACWMLTAWTSIVAMHTLGSYYEAHQQPSRGRPRQGQPVPSSKSAATPAGR
ncbi:hypothetical protein [Singulisphaera acidiphila]|uniref:Uncharacterized protein n=1 Tax=Singulisphaera acidiphila (strain ATCC BAA-1392 / DSM 18658 / VKM B-2454 / MOB10) TaxID=886293 RepID=L0DHM8_SINAD|nr:hypothetical protein [Singulisphaera acidiphila]AGA28767.1 hypothetical protein Sinac_4589 [Singulisphaera acidiphila DSM 18658]